MSKNTILLLGSILLLLSTSLLFTNRSEPETPQTEIVLRLAESMPPNHPSAKASQYFTDLVLERSGGSIQIQVYYNGELGTDLETLNQTQFGGIAFARIDLLTMAEELPVLEQYLQPNAYNPDALIAAMQSAQEEINQIFEYEQIIPLVLLFPDYRCIANTLRPVKTAEDIADLILKVPKSSVVANHLSDLGAHSLIVMAGDIFRSLGNGSINGVECSFMEYCILEYDGLLENLTLSNYICPPDILMASGVALGNLDIKDQSIIKDCAEETYLYHKELLEMEQRRYMEEFRDRGIIIETSPLEAQP